ncbi:unnamed protein product [Ilex paraguariensis]|uniref:Zinc finger CCCH domain-containing protein 5 n=1 Tax=Ilex paraguariensis TaxID=185542 RepID=A0ABC8TGB6_9AQUA
MAEPIEIEEEEKVETSKCVQEGETSSLAPGGGPMMMNRKEKRKALKKEKRKEKRKELAEKAREEEEARINDAEEQRRIQLAEERENERMERERREFEERERLFLEALARKKAEEEEEERRRALEEEESKKIQVAHENEGNEDDEWEYIEEGPPEIIWQGNEIIVKKKKVRVKKKDADLQAKTEDPNRPTSNPLPPQSEAFSDYKNMFSAQQLLENVAQQVPNFGTEQDKAHCPFHLKTGACRFGSRCSRVHFYPDKSCTLLIKNMYSGPGLAWEQDEGLEYMDEEVERCYEEFYEDVHTEFLKFGEIVNFKVCRNGSSHLRGNVYVHYKSLDSAALAYQSINGRYFAGKQYMDEEVERCYEEFYEDVHTEFLKFGEIVNFKVCRNGSSHLRGNVYVHYKSLDSAALAYQSINGRYFAGKQVTCEFVSVTRWKIAICGEYMKLRFKACSRGTACNFIHCFRNPGGDYEWADLDKPPPRYWLKRMAALFGHSNESGYEKQMERESSEQLWNTRKILTTDTESAFSGLILALCSKRVTVKLLVDTAYFSSGGDQFMIELQSEPICSSEVVHCHMLLAWWGYAGGMWVCKGRKGGGGERERVRLWRHHSRRSRSRERECLSGSSREHYEEHDLHRRVHRQRHNSDARRQSKVLDEKIGTEETSSRNYRHKNRTHDIDSDLDWDKDKNRKHDRKRKSSRHQINVSELRDDRDRKSKASATDSDGDMSDRETGKDRYHGRTKKSSERQRKVSEILDDFDDSKNTIRGTDYSGDRLSEDKDRGRLRRQSSRYWNQVSVSPDDYWDSRSRDHDSDSSDGGLDADRDEHDRHSRECLRNSNEISVLSDDQGGLKKIFNNKVHQRESDLAKFKLQKVQEHSHSSRRDCLGRETSEADFPDERLKSGENLENTNSSRYDRRIKSHDLESRYGSNKKADKRGHQESEKEFPDKHKKSKRKFKKDERVYYDSPDRFEGRSKSYDSEYYLDDGTGRWEPD